MSQETVMLCGDAFAVYSRIFDHRAVIKEECRYMVREFELKKNQEQAKAFLDIKLTTGKVKHRIPDCANLLNTKLEALHKHVINTASQGLDILAQDHSDLKLLKEKYKKERDEDADKFFKEMENAQNDVLRKHQTSMDELDNT